MRCDLYREPSGEVEHYLAGLVLTDGCVAKRHGKPEEVRIAMAMEALPLLESLRNYRDGRVYITKRKPPRKDECLLVYRDVPWLWKRQIPLLEDENRRHYLRGMVDGDGCLTRGTAYREGYTKFEPRLEFHYSLRERFVGEFMAEALTREGIIFSIRERPEQTTGHLLLSTYQALNLSSLIYSDCTVVHPRKLAIANAWKSGEYSLCS